MIAAQLVLILFAILFPGLMRMALTLIFVAALISLRSDPSALNVAEILLTGAPVISFSTPVQGRTLGQRSRTCGRIDGRFPLQKQG
jgi:hypothetical protein